jgi:glycosyltransferase involved in cell wall biosynthesis
MMTKSPLISIIMPTYNAARFIGKAVDSVLAQTYPHWELIIVDDASSDDTEAIVNAYNDSRIRYTKVSRIGHPAGVRNTGLRMAQGDYIAFLDSDDLYFPETLEKLLQPLQDKPELVAAYGFSFNIDEHENPLPGTIALQPKENPKSGEAAYYPSTDYSHCWKNIVTSNISCLLPALMLRRSTQQTIGFFNESLCGPEDYEFYVRLFLHNHAGVQVLSDYVYQYRIHSASLTKAPEHCERLLSSCLKIMAWMFEEASIPAEVRHLRSEATVACYRYLARERLLHHQPTLARHLALKAYQDPFVSTRDFLKSCGPLLLRSFVPSSMDSLLVKLKRQLRERSSMVKPIPGKAVSLR